ncbi:MAG TPA: dUTP diphosphatase, partial [Patescibacteria group bacterium]|nr:dUTP diphosphatase [Patescibacteria group bacterium]
MKIKIKKLNPLAILPKYAHPGDVGLDLFSLEDYDLKPGERRVFDLGFAAEFETGYAAIVKDKSGLPKKAGLHT